MKQPATPALCRCPRCIGTVSSPDGDCPSKKEGAPLRRATVTFRLGDQVFVGYGSSVLDAAGRMVKVAA